MCVSRFSIACSRLEGIRRVRCHGTASSRSVGALFLALVNVTDIIVQAMAAVGFEYRAAKGKGSKRKFKPPPVPPRPTLTWDEVRYDSR